MYVRLSSRAFTAPSPPKEGVCLVRYACFSIAHTRSISHSVTILSSSKVFLERLIYALMISSNPPCYGMYFAHHHTNIINEATALGVWLVAYCFNRFNAWNPTIF